MVREASSLLEYFAFSSSTAFFLMKGSVGEICPSPMALSTARSGSSNVWVGPLWQSTHCI